jgi:hypothetical protein
MYEYTINTFLRVINIKIVKITEINEDSTVQQLSHLAPQNVIILTFAKQRESVYYCYVRLKLQYIAIYIVVSQVPISPTF